MVIPRTNCRWVATNNKIDGITSKVVAAMMTPQEEASFSDRNIATPICTVRMSVEWVVIKGHRY